MSTAEDKERFDGDEKDYEELVAYVKLDAEVRVRFPPGILRSEHVDANGNLKDKRLAEAAVNAAIGFLSRDGEIDGAGDLSIPFCSKSNTEPGSSMILVDAGDWTYMDAGDVRVEDE